MPVYNMSDCVYVAWEAAARDLGVEPRNHSRAQFELARSLVGEPEGLWAGAAPVVLGLLCRMHDLSLTVTCHPWFDTDYYRAAAETRWQHWALDLWGTQDFWQDLQTPSGQSADDGSGAIYFWLGGHHAYYASEPNPEQFLTMRIYLHRREDEE